MRSEVFCDKDGTSRAGAVEVAPATCLDELREWLKISSNLSKEQQVKLDNLPAKFFDVFAVEAIEVETVQLPATEHIINTGNQQPIKQHLRRVPYTQHEEISWQTASMLDQNIIEHSFQQSLSESCRSV